MLFVIVEKLGAPAPLLLRKVRMKLRITTKNQPTSTLAPGHSLHAAVQCVASSTDVVRFDEDADDTLDRLLAVWISCSEAMVPLAPKEFKLPGNRLKMRQYSVHPSSAPFSMSCPTVCSIGCAIPCPPSRPILQCAAPRVISHNI